MINQDKINEFNFMLGLCGPDYLFDIAHEQIGNYCLAKLQSNDDTAYIHDITMGKGIEKEYFCTATVSNPQKKPGWYICKYTDVKDDGYDELDTHLFVPVIESIRYIDDGLISDDKSPLLIFMLICINNFAYTHVESFEKSPLENVNPNILIRSCSRIDPRIAAFNLSMLRSSGRIRMMELFLNNDITENMIATWINPYHI